MRTGVQDFSEVTIAVKDAVEAFIDSMQHARDDCEVCEAMSRFGIVSAFIY